MLLFKLATCCLVLLLTQACTNYTVSVRTSTPSSYTTHGEGGMHIGLGQADLTPPPGAPMMGYSMAGRFSRGRFTSLHATAIAINDARGTTMVIVATDLWGIPRGLKHRVVELLQTRYGHTSLGEEDVLLTATHTHHGPGAYAPDNAFTLGSPGFAFDPAMFNFIASPITESINNALNDRKSGRSLSYSVTTVDSVVENRSYKAFARNPSAEKLNGASDERVHVLSVSEGSTVIAVLAHLSVHPTAIGDAGELYSADIFGVARALLVQQHPNTLYGFFNGAEGDQAPQRINEHGLRKTWTMGAYLASAVNNAVNGNTIKIDGTITHRYEHMSLPDQPVVVQDSDMTCFCQVPDRTIHTSQEARVGVAALGGAADGRTMFYHLGMRDGVRSDDDCDPEHGVKINASAYALDSILAFGLNTTLSRAVSGMIGTKPSPVTTISVHTIGDLTLIGAPGEFTAALGRRITDSVTSALGASNHPTIFCGLSDDYVSYVTTPCEYAEQFYEGASTYWGPNMGMLFAQKFKSLAEHMPLTGSDRRGESTTYTAGQAYQFIPNALERHTEWDPNVSLAPFLQGDSVVVVDWAAPNKTTMIARDGRHVLRVRFRASYAALTKDGNMDGIRFYPEVQWTQQPSVPLQTALTIDALIPPVAEWSYWIFDPEMLNTSVHEFTIKGFETAQRTFKIQVK